PKMVALCSFALFPEMLDPPLGQPRQLLNLHALAHALAGALTPHRDVLPYREGHGAALPVPRRGRQRLPPVTRPRLPSPATQLPQPRCGALVREALVLARKCARLAKVDDATLPLALALQAKVGVLVRVVPGRRGPGVVVRHVGPERGHLVLVYLGHGLGV